MQRSSAPGNQQSRSSGSTTGQHAPSGAAASPDASQGASQSVQAYQHMYAAQPQATYPAHAQASTGYPVAGFAPYNALSGGQGSAGQGLPTSGQAGYQGNLANAQPQGGYGQSTRSQPLQPVPTPAQMLESPSYYTGTPSTSHAVAGSSRNVASVTSHAVAGSSHNVPTTIHVPEALSAAPQQPERHACDKCASTFTRAYDLKRHHETLHADANNRPKHKCHKCGHEYARRDIMLRHLESCNGQA